MRQCHVRSILKLVHQCLVSETHTSPPLSLKIGKHHCSLSQGHKRDALSYSERMHNSQNFPNSTGENLQCHHNPILFTPSPPHHSLDSPAAQRFFSLLCLSKNRHPPKNAGRSTKCLLF